MSSPAAPDPRPVRLVRRICVRIARAYPPIPRLDQAELHGFIDAAVADAWHERGWRGLIGVQLGLVADVVRSRAGGEPALTQRGRSLVTDSRVRSWRTRMDGLMHDVRYSSRRLLRTPGFTITALLTLALGIGTATTVFTVVDGSMLRPFSYPEMDRLVTLGEAAQDGNRMSVSWLNFVDWRQQNEVLQELGIYRGWSVNLTGKDAPERLNGAVVSAAIFDSVAIAPLYGRAFGAADDQQGARKTAILSERLWRSRFGANPAIVGQTITLSNEPYEVVGVMPAGMRFPSRLTDVWVSLGPVVGQFPPARGAHPGLTGFGRLKPGLSLEQARAGMAVIAKRLSDQYPDSNLNTQIVVESYYEQVVQNVRPAFKLLLSAVGLVLLIACANLASLMLARAEASQRDLSIRAALGAGRLRLVRQLLSEALLLSVTGGALGVAFAYWAVGAFVGSRPTTIPRIDLIGVDWRVLIFALGASIVTGVLFGVAPALRGSFVDAQHALRAGRDGQATGARRLRSVLVAAEIAIALILLVGAGLLGRSLSQLMAIELGFNPSRAVTMQIALPPAAYPTVESWTTFHRTLLERVANTPGIEAAGLSSGVPLSGNSSESPVIKEGDPVPSATQKTTMCLFQTGSAGYFRAIGMTLLRGRGFDDRDTETSPKVAIVDDLLVAKLFGDKDAIGQRIAFEFVGEGHGHAQPQYREIIGVVRHVKFYGLQSEPPYVQVFTSYTQLPYWVATRRPAMTLVARTAGETAPIVTAVRDAVRAVDPRIPVYGVQAMTDTVNQTIEQPRISLTLFAGFAAMALVLAVIGVYGVLSYAVTQRTREIGVRMAMGAGRGQIARLIGRQAAWLVAAGLAIGLGGALALSRLLATLLYQVSPTDPWTFGVVAAVLTITAGVAAWLPARRATRVDPLVALRAD